MARMSEFTFLSSDGQTALSAREYLPEGEPVGEQGRGVIRAYKCFLKAGMKDVTMKLYHGGRHEMLNETNRTEVYEDVLSWLNSKTGK